MFLKKPWRNPRICMKFAGGVFIYTLIYFNHLNSICTLSFTYKGTWGQEISLMKYCGRRSSASYWVINLHLLGIKHFSLWFSAFSSSLLRAALLMPSWPIPPPLSQRRPPPPSQRLWAVAGAAGNWECRREMWSASRQRCARCCRRLGACGRSQGAEPHPE